MNDVEKDISIAEGCQSELLLDHLGKSKLCFYVLFFFFFGTVKRERFKSAITFCTKMNLKFTKNGFYFFISLFI